MTFWKILLDQNVLRLKSHLEAFSPRKTYIFLKALDGIFEKNIMFMGYRPLDKDLECIVGWCDIFFNILE